MESLLCPGTQCIWKPMCNFQEWCIHFPKSHGSPAQKLHWTSMPDALGALSPSAKSPGMGTWCWAQNSRSFRYVSVIQLLSSLELPTWQVWGCLYQVITPPASWCGLLFVFWSRISFWKFPAHLVEDCSTFGCNSVVFMKEIELQPFYSAILILSPVFTSLFVK